MNQAKDVTIRQAVTADLDAILPLVEAYRVFYKQTPDPKAEHAFIQRHLRYGTSAIYLAWLDGSAVGFMQLFRTYSTVHLANAWILEDLYVLPECRGSGVASALLERAVQVARESGASGMFLETAHDNVAAQRVYERAGWTREGRFYKYNAPLAGAQG